MSKFDRKLKLQVEKMGTTSTQTEIPVILHFKKGADLKKLERHGFNLEKVISMESSLASGTITSASVLGMESDEDVEYLELDHEAEILPTQ